MFIETGVEFVCYDYVGQLVLDLRGDLVDQRVN